MKNRWTISGVSGALLDASGTPVGPSRDCFDVLHGADDGDPDLERAVSLYAPLVAWLDDEGWQRVLRYKPDTMVTEVQLRHEGLGIELLCNDAVDYWSPVYFRKVTVTDLLGRPHDRLTKPLAG